MAIIRIKDAFHHLLMQDRVDLYTGIFNMSTFLCRRVRSTTGIYY
jgi:hypothetical protein